MTVSGLADALKAGFPADCFAVDPATRATYGYDNSRRHAQPEAVLWARDEADVQAAVRLCAAGRWPLTVRGRGTNTTGATVPVRGGLVLSMERMRRILAIRPGDRMAIVEPGVLNGELQNALRPHGLFWAPDPTSAPFSTIGGNLGCNAGGPRAVKYGATRDNVLGLSAIAGDGSHLRTGAAVTKLSCGIDLTRLLIGSEGTLAIITEATLKLLPIPPDRAALRACFRDIDSAAAAVARLMAQPETPAMLEFLDGDCVALVRAAGVGLPDGCGALLMLEVDGATGQLPAACEALRSAVAGEGLMSIESALDANDQERLWAARKALSPSLRRLRPGKINEDVVVPVSRIPALVSLVGRLSREHALPVVCFGHAGNGNLHVNVLYDPADPRETERAEQAMHALFAALPAMEGQLSGEHGIGLAKRPFMTSACDAGTLSMLRRIKATFDPAGILNPGKLLPD